ncbi:hypothetical protein E2C01_091070 [Portunus trituberculatus]|uniref:Uncharacterized protein n=1 Tax=Portunus trituberculatus TaxID=210409 RepID=A0A5B7JI81_PORTR|nr:hypothetical protein [Portunus trituberculatus]
MSRDGVVTREGKGACRCTQVCFECATTPLTWREADVDALGQGQQDYTAAPVQVTGVLVGLVTEEGRVQNPPLNR